MLGPVIWSNLLLSVLSQRNVLYCVSSVFARSVVHSFCKLNNLAALHRNVLYCVSSVFARSVVHSFCKLNSLAALQALAIDSL